MTTLTEADLRAIEERCSEATPGPWEFRATEHSGGIKFVVAPNTPRNDNGTEFIPADCSHGYNGRFIAAARSDVPKLINEIRRLRQVLQELGHGG